MNTHQFYINGRWVNPIDGYSVDVINPSSEQVCATVSLGGEADLEAAVTAARRALHSWSTVTKDARLALMKRVLAVYESRIDEMGDLISREMGAPLDMARTDQAGSGNYHMRAFIRALEEFEFEQPLRDDAPDTRIIFEPIGVCGLITPWNWPMNQIALKVMPALATGCTMILKPSELSPLNAMLFAEIMDEAGVPAGVFNLVNGDGAGIGTMMSGHPDIALISFTGSSRAGIAITKNAADSLKRVSLELGGKGANIIFNDAAEEAVGDGVRRCFYNSGQSCNAPTRMLIQRARYESALEQAREVAQRITVDEAEKAGSHIGPVVSQQQYDKIQRMIERGVSEDGARLLVGGTGRPEGVERGYFVRPTIFADCHNKMGIMREEIFGPVLSMMPFDTEEEAIEIANDTAYGLTNYVQTADVERSHRVARQLRSGMVDINGQARAAGSPFGGYKQSGNGREGGRWGMEEFLETKAVGGWRPD